MLAGTASYIGLNGLLVAVCSSSHSCALKQRGETVALRPLMDPMDHLQLSWPMIRLSLGIVVHQCL